MGSSHFVLCGGKQTGLANIPKGPITSWQIVGETVADFIFLGSKITADGDCKESYDQPRQHIKKQRHYFAIKGPSSQGYGFSSGHVWM